MNKFLLAAIAAGLWANAAGQWLRPAEAQYRGDTESYLKNIDLNIERLVKGGAGCRNMKICD